MMWCGFRQSDSQCPSTCGCPEGVAAQERRCRLQFKVKEALIQRQRLDPAPFLQWMFGKTEAVYVELQVHSPGTEAYRTDAGQAQTMHEAKTQALWALEEKFSWRASQDFDADAPKCIFVFDDLSTFSEVEVRLLSCEADTEELLGEALLKVDQDVEDWVGLEGELVVPLVRTSRVCGYVMFDVKLNCDGGTNPPRRFPQDGKGLSMLAVVGRPALKLPVETRRLLMDEEVEEIVPDFTWKDRALSKDLDAASPRTPQTVVKDAQSMRTRTPPGTPHAAAPAGRGQPMATNFTTKDLAPRPLPQMPEDPVEEAVPLPSPGVFETSAELIPGLSEPRVNARFAPPPHPELTAELGPMITAAPGPKPLTPPGPRPLSGATPGPRPLGTPQGQRPETGPGSMGPIPGTGPPGPWPGPPGPRPGSAPAPGPMAGPSGPKTGPSGLMPGPSGPMAGPSGPRTGPSGLMPGPSGPMAGPSGPKTGPSGLMPGPSGPMAGPSGLMPGPSGPMAGPSGPMSGPSGLMPGPSGPMAGPSGPKTGPSGLTMAGLSGMPGPSGPMAGPSGPSFGPAVAGTPPSRSFESQGTSSEKLKKRTAKSDGKSESSSLLAPRATASASPSESVGTASFSSFEADGQHSSFETNPAANTDGTKVKKKKAKSNKQLQG